METGHIDKYHFRPNVSYGKSNSYSISESGTFNGDPFNLVSNPNEFLNKIFWGSTDDPLEAIRVNASNSESKSEGQNLSANASLQVNRRLNNQGRNITFRGTFSYGDNDSEQFSESLTRYFDDNAKKKMMSVNNILLLQPKIMIILPN